MRNDCGLGKFCYVKQNGPKHWTDEIFQNHVPFSEPLEQSSGYTTGCVVHALSMDT